VTRIFYKGAQFVILTYDITRDETFANLGYWIKEIRNHAAEDVIVYLIGNKSDQEESREVTTMRALDFAKTNGINKCFETSAKNGSMVETIFTCAGKELY